MIFETDVLKGMCFQAVETRRFQHGVKLMSTCTALPRAKFLWLLLLRFYYSRAPCLPERGIPWRTPAARGRTGSSAGAAGAEEAAPGRVWHT